MDIFDFIILAGGLGFFLYGMNIMGNGLEKLAGSKLDSILRKVTGNPVSAVLFGALITAAIQSSSATTVIVVGLVNAGIMKLDQAIGIIMGANIGTTITAQIVSLSNIKTDNVFIMLLKPDFMAPLFAIIGAVMFVFLKNAKVRNIGQTLLGFGILFAGMFSMQDAVAGLAELPAFKEMFSTLQNPLLGVLAGALVTGIIQSSAASIGILQALTVTGAITWSTAIPIILGQNIGTCVTPMIASIGASKGAKRSAFAHLYFNIIGTLIFLGTIYGGAALFAEGGAFCGDNFISRFFTGWGMQINSADIANFHTLFNIIVTLLFLPFTKVLARLAEWTIRDKGEASDAIDDLPVLDERLLQSPAVALQQARSAVEAMATRSRANFSHSLNLLFEYDADRISTIMEMEETIDQLEVSVTNYLVRLTDKPLSETESHAVSELLYFVTEFERIGDYVVNVVDRSGEVHDKEIVFSDAAIAEFRVLDRAISEALDLAIRCFTYDDASMARQVEPLEETIDHICEILRTRHINRLKNSQCNIESGIVYLELLTNLERISDHCSNVAARIIGNEYTDEDFDAHALRRNMHNGQYEQYNTLKDQYEEKYISVINKKAEA